MPVLGPTWKHLRSTLSQRVKTPALRSLARTLANDARYHYAYFHTTDSTGALLLRNALRPKRIIMKGLYGQLRQAPQPTSSVLAPFPTAQESRPDVAEAARRLRQDGILIVPGLFADAVGRIRQRYDLDRFKASRDCYAARRFDPRREDDVGGIATDDFVLSVFAKHFGRQPFLQHLPGIAITVPDFDDADYQRSLHTDERGTPYLGKKNANLNWHYDTVNQVSIHVHLSDVSATTSHMLYARGSHLRHHNYLHHDFDYYYSDEYVRSHYDIVPCVGPAGTAVLFDSNGLHRLYPVAKGYRSLLIIDWSPGNDCAYFRFNEKEIPTRPNSPPAPALDQERLNTLQRASLGKLPAYIASE